MNTLIAITVLFLARIVLPVLVLLTLGEMARNNHRRTFQTRW